MHWIFLYLSLAWRLCFRWVYESSSFYENACFVKLALGLSKVVLLGNYDSGLGDSNQISLFRGFGIDSNPILMIL